ncbi:glycoside hydrolase family 13 protein [Microbacterium sp. LMI1-1-1.1]|uniref:glycoside hydrolase family 13 protein n=1 Tax=Microbacterium sp. LMI1-1-1.1 TaxID=3135223 RepID=UPI0039C9E819
MSMDAVSARESAWAQRPDWWKRAVVYQVYPRSFQDSDGDGVGDLRGVLSRLDHLAYLGVDVLWLSPIYRSPHADNGYDISDYRDIDPLFGTLDDLDALVNAAHARGIRIVMDLVVNHTSDEHAWFAESRSGRDSPRRDWYWWSPARPGHEPGTPGAEPTNWESFFSGPVWQWDEVSGEYYLHLFDRKQPDLNWENPEVRHAVYDMMRWWLHRGIDGFRMDVINLISKRLPLSDAPERPEGGWADGSSLYMNGPRLHEFLQEMHREVFAGRSGLLTVGETPGVTVEEARLLTDPARAEVDMVFQFDHVGLDHGPEGKFAPQRPEPGALAASFTQWQDALADVGWNSLYLANHDQARPVSRFGDDERYWRESATALATILHLQRGTPYVYQGEEIGMTNAPFADIDAFRDVESLNHYAEAMARGSAPADVLLGLASMSRDNARTPVQWESTPTAGFTTGEPWLAVNPNAARISVAAQRGVPGSVLEHYRALIALRHDLDVVAEGTFARLDVGDPAVFAFVRAFEGEELLVLANLSSDPRPVALAGAEDWDAAVAVLSNVDLPARVSEAVAAPLAPWAAAVWHRRAEG